ncbi:hypothetical protein F4W66_15065 [Escherichia coli]|nr:hypothetical protein F4W66_15065 [Escherichia coli]
MAGNKGQPFHRCVYASLKHCGNRRRDIRSRSRFVAVYHGNERPVKRDGNKAKLQAAIFIARKQLSYRYAG